MSNEHDNNNNNNNMGPGGVNFDGGRGSGDTCGPPDGNFDGRGSDDFGDNFAPPGGDDAPPSLTFVAALPWVVAGTTAPLMWVMAATTTLPPRVVVGTTSPLPWVVATTLESMMESMAPLVATVDRLPSASMLAHLPQFVVDCHFESLAWPNLVATVVDMTTTTNVVDMTAMKVPWSLVAATLALTTCMVVLP